MVSSYFECLRMTSQTGVLMLPLDRRTLAFSGTGGSGAPRSYRFRLPGKRFGGDAVMRDKNWLVLEVVTISGRAAAVGFHLRFDVVEVWHDDCNRAVFDRETLRSWLERLPGEPLRVDDVTLSTDFSLDSRGRVAITLPEVNEWALSPAEHEQLRDRA